MQTKVKMILSLIFKLRQGASIGRFCLSVRWSDGLPELYCTPALVLSARGIVDNVTSITGRVLVGKFSRLARIMNVRENNKDLC